MKKSVLLVLVVASLALLNGCILFVAGGAAAAGAGTVAYVNGELKDTEDHSLDPVHDATVAGVQDMQYVIVNTAKDAGQFKLTVRTATDQKIDITLIKQSPNSTEIRIRVGTFGDEQLSRQLLDKIKAHL
jgi:hypothetical protein